MIAGWITAGLTALGLGGGLVYTAGQLVAVLKQLRAIAEDHEDRIRLLEGRPPRHVIIPQRGAH